jgi:hypothetical protein
LQEEETVVSSSPTQQASPDYDYMILQAHKVQQSSAEDEEWEELLIACKELHIRERSYLPGFDIFGNHPSLKPRMRTLLYDWLIEVIIITILLFFFFSFSFFPFFSFYLVKVYFAILVEF